MQLPTTEFAKKKLDWRVTAGMGISIVWLMLLALYLSQKVSWQQFLQLPIDHIGGFLGGVFSPLAFLWLVIGFFIQQNEIDENSRNLETQVQHTNLDNFLKMADIVYRHIGVISGFIYLSCRKDIEATSNDMPNIEDSWSRSSMGDHGVFARYLLAHQFDENGKERDMANIFYGTETRRRHSDNYKKVFEDLLKNAGLCDATDSLHNALVDGSVWGILYKTMITVEATLPNEIASSETESSRS